MGRLKLCGVTAFVVLIGAPHAPSATAAEQAVAAINRGVVELETSGSAGISVRIAEDLANLVDDAHSDQTALSSETRPRERRHGGRTHRNHHPPGILLRVAKAMSAIAVAKETFKP